MKASNLHNLRIFILGALVAVVVGCGQKGSDPGPPPPPPMAPAYTYVNGVCLDPATNTQVNPNLCINNGVPGSPGYSGSPGYPGTPGYPGAPGMPGYPGGMPGGNFRWSGYQCVDINGLMVADQLCAGAPGGPGVYPGMPYPPPPGYPPVGGYPPQNCYPGGMPGMQPPPPGMPPGPGCPMPMPMPIYNPQVCNGPYLLYQGGIPQPINCYGANCSGRTLVEAQSGRPVVCR